MFFPTLSTSLVGFAALAAAAPHLNPRSEKGVAARGYSQPFERGLTWTPRRNNEDHDHDRDGRDDRDDGRDRDHDRDDDDRDDDDRDRNFVEIAQLINIQLSFDDRNRERDFGDRIGERMRNNDRNRRDRDEVRRNHYRNRNGNVNVVIVVITEIIDDRDRDDNRDDDRDDRDDRDRDDDRDRRDREREDRDREERDRREQEDRERKDRDDRGERDENRDREDRERRERYDREREDRDREDRERDGRGRRYMMHQVHSNENFQEQIIIVVSDRQTMTIDSFDSPVFRRQAAATGVPTPPVVDFDPAANIVANNNTVLLPAGVPPPTFNNAPVEADPADILLPGTDAFVTFGQPI